MVSPGGKAVIPIRHERSDTLRVAHERAVHVGQHDRANDAPRTPHRRHRRKRQLPLVLAVGSTGTAGAVGRFAFANADLDQLGMLLVCILSCLLVAYRREHLERKEFVSHVNTTADKRLREQLLDEMLPVCVPPPSVTKVELPVTVTVPLLLNKTPMVVVPLLSALAKAPAALSVSTARR